MKWGAWHRNFPVYLSVCLEFNVQVVCLKYLDTEGWNFFKCHCFNAHRNKGCVSVMKVTTSVNGLLLKKMQFLLHVCHWMYSVDICYHISLSDYLKAVCVCFLKFQKLILFVLCFTHKCLSYSCCQIKLIILLIIWWNYKDELWRHNDETYWFFYRLKFS